MHYLPLKRRSGLPMKKRAISIFSFTVQTVAASVRTGDDGHVSLWIGLAAAAAGIGFVLKISRKKPKEN